MISKYRLALVTVALLAQPAAVWAMCGDAFQYNAFGRPIDYTNPADKEYVTVWVEPFHFTRDVESLTRGKSSDLPGDLSYTLRQIPNHHRALNSMMRWQLAHRLPLDAEERRIYTIECYFERALAMSETDPVIHLLQGIYFQRTKKLEDAMRSYQRAIDLNQNLAEAFYNRGLLMFEMERYEDAKSDAQRAYELGYPMPGLRNKLQKINRW